MVMMTVPILFDNCNGLPESAGILQVLPVVAAMLADGVLRMEPVYLQVGEHERQLMEIRLVPQHESEKRK
jgi:hypothetical protein